MNNYILLNPGPVNLDPRVRESAIKVDYCHRQEEFIDILMEVKDKLKTIINKPDSHVSILHGGGALSVESALQTLVDGNVLVINNGLYCERIEDSLSKKSNTCVDSLSLQSGEFPSIEVIKNMLCEKHYDWIALVHHETATGLLNPLSEICDLVDDSSTKVFVDAVSSIGAHEVDNRCSVICFNSNKCLEAIPGAAIVVWDKDLKVVDDNIIAYLNLYNYVGDKMRTTLNTNSIVSLNTALDIFLSEDRLKRYEDLAAYIREEGSKYYKLFLDGHYSNVLTSFVIEPEKYEPIRLEAKKNGFILYHGSVADQFRVSNMGTLINKKEIKRLFECIGGR